MSHNNESQQVPIEGNEGSPNDQPSLPSSSATGSSRHPPAVDAQHRQPDEVQQDGEQLQASQQHAQPNSPAHAGRAPSNRTEGGETRSENDSTERERSGHEGSTIVELIRELPQPYRPVMACFWIVFLALVVLGITAGAIGTGVKWASQPKTFKSLQKQLESLEKRFDSLENRFDSLEKQFEQFQGMFKLLEKQNEQSPEILQSLEKRNEQFFEGTQPYCPVDYYVPYGPLVHPIHAGGNGANNRYPAYEGVVAGNLM